MRKREAATWVEVDRQSAGFQSSTGRSGPWFSQVFRVIEARKENGRTTDYRERLVYGGFLRASAYPEPAVLALMESVAQGAAVLAQYAEDEEKLKTAATSKRKRR